MGVFLIIAAFRVRRYAGAVYLVFAMIFAGGLARLSVLRTDVVLAPDLITSLIVELFAMPVLTFWLWRITRSVPTAPANAEVSRAASR